MKQVKWTSSRIILKDVQPLNYPLHINIEAASNCNFKCIYCHQSTNESNKIKKVMSINLVNNLVSKMD